MPVKIFSRWQKYPFNVNQGLIIVKAQIEGPAGRQNAYLALDTGASGTMLETQLLLDLGYDPGVATAQIEMTTGSGIETVPRLPVMRLTSLGQERQHFPVVAHTLPSTAIVDGLLGLDFFRNQKLTLDFRRGQISLY